MDIRARLQQAQQVHAQHVQLAQQTQANIIRLEGAMEMLRELVAAEDVAAKTELPGQREERRIQGERDLGS